MCTMIYVFTRTCNQCECFADFVHYTLVFFILNTSVTTEQVLSDITLYLRIDQDPGEHRVPVKAMNIMFME